MAYTQISQLPEPGNRATDTPQEFSSKTDSLLSNISNFVTQTNAAGDYIDSKGSQVEADSAQAAIDAQTASESSQRSDANANFVGLWSNQTGVASVPYSVSHNSKSWQLLNDLADVTASEPGVTGDWKLINDINLSNLRQLKLSSPTMSILGKNNIVESLGGLLSFSRNSTATYIDRSGIIQTAAFDDPRQSKDGWVFEGSATNEITFSDCSTSNLTASAGITNQQLVQFNFGVAFPDLNTANESAYKKFTTVAGQDYSFSLFIKMNDLGAPVPTDQNTGGDFNFRIAGDTISTVKVELINKTQGLYLISGSYTATTSGLTNFGLLQRTGHSGKGFVISGFNVQISDHITSYIPTLASPASRAAEIMHVEFNQNIPANQDMTLIFETSVRLSSGIKTFLRADMTTGTILSGVFNGDFGNKWGSDTAINGPITDDQPCILAVSIRNGVGDIYTNGVKSDQSVTVNLETPNTTSLFVGSNNGVDGITGVINSMKIYDFALNQDEIKYLSGV